HSTNAIQKHIDLCGLNADPKADKVTPHTFRDTYAARLVPAGVSLQKVSQLLGHSNILMTQKYAHLCPDALGAEAVAVLNGLHSMNPIV
ncbi:tyrosine-type recombinase/integrase, partial [Streptomyces virginiae]|uniref:tyrosine-type recombinase/integrase n=1 Tax=Streptomyces virginiae TaxID=1961 RepID=UPI0035DA3167